MGPPRLDQLAVAIVSESDDRGEHIRFVSIGLDDRDLLARSRDLVGGLPVVVDETAETMKSWRLNAIPVLVLLDALAAGGPVPTPSPSPAPSK